MGSNALLPRRWSAPIWVSIGLGAMLIAEVLHQAHLQLAHGPLTTPSAQPSTVLRSGLSSRNLPLEIAHAHLFGISPAAAIGTITDTRLPLILTGVIASSDSLGGRAIIAAQGRAAHVYGVGAALMDGSAGHIAQILPDQVLLDFGDHRETLRLPGRRTAAALAPLPPLAAPPPLAAAAPTDDEAGAAFELDPTVVHPRLAQTAAETAFAGLNVRASPDGNIHIAPEPRVQRLYGLRDGDQVIAVNGVSNPSAQALQSLLESAPQSLSVVVMRNGASVVINIPVDE
jgi:type II secretory pathway component PulC